MKYIDAEKLKEAIKRFSATEYSGELFADDVANGALDYVLEEIIPALQQKQPEVDLENEINAVWNPRFNLGWDEHSALSMNHAGFASIARHFYELGLKAPEEMYKS